ncbi:efflux transporter outer membrane subunit [Novosphingobium lindaniclasticum]|uniref:efflux transporter outer membrane subunit n=1 Tax=Novosphingobium lindaniclasticum TaxID=1329895 RepID=UPI0003F8DEB0|nr:efflux transporter outer membrane subunit [Novosphingobium lindaniclasticum]
MKPIRRFCLASIGLLSACASPTYRPRIAPPPVPQGWIATAESAPGDTGGLDVVKDRWWRGFGDPALDAAVDRALANNVDLKIAASRIMQARAELAAERSLQRPWITASSKAARDRGLNAFGEPVDQTDARADIGISYEVDLFGRLKAGTEAARSTALASEASRDTVRLGLIATTVQSYLTLLALDAKRRIAADTEGTRREELARILRRTNAGYAGRLDLEQAKIELASASQLVAEIDRDIEINERSLNILEGSNPAPVERKADLYALHLAPAPTALPSEIVRKRPDIAAAELRLAAASFRLTAARDAFLPKLQLTPTGGGIVSTLLSSPVTLFSLGGSVLTPLFEGGQLRAREDLAGAQVEEAALAYRLAVMTAFGEVEKALSGLRLDRDDLLLARSREAAATQAFQTAQRRYLSGYSSYIDQLDAQRGLLQAQLVTIDATAQQFQDLVALYQALGGGWDAKVQAVPSGRD